MVSFFPISPQHLPGNLEISSEDTKCALFKTESNQNPDKNEKSNTHPLNDLNLLQYS